MAPNVCKEEGKPAGQQQLPCPAKLFAICNGSRQLQLLFLLQLQLRLANKNMPGSVSGCSSLLADGAWQNIKDEQLVMRGRQNIVANKPGKRENGQNEKRRIEILAINMKKASKQQQQEEEDGDENEDEEAEEQWQQHRSGLGMALDAVAPLAVAFIALTGQLPVASGWAQQGRAQQRRQATSGWSCAVPQVERCLLRV